MSPAKDIINKFIAKLYQQNFFRIHNDIFELGLIDAFGNEIVLIEWPDRLGYLEPSNALTIEIIILEDDKREVIFSTTADMWEARLEKTLQD